MKTTARKAARNRGGVMGRSVWFLSWLILILTLCRVPAQATITVTASGPSGSVSQTVAGTGGPFDLNLPLARNAVNTITVTATDTDSSGNKVTQSSQSLKVAQLSLDQVVVSKVTATPLSVAEIKQLVNDGVISLDNPANYNVSKFDIVLTIGEKLVPVSVPVVTPVMTPETGFEPAPPPPGGGGGGGGPTPQPPPDVVVFDQPLPSPPGVSIPPHISGVIVIEGTIKSLKEFYTVRLLLMNTSGIFTLNNVTANISFPDGGLSSTAPADGVISYGSITPGDGTTPGQAERQFIIRGDAIGVNRIKVDFGGTVGGPLIPDDEQIPFNGSAQTQVTVKGPPTFKVVVTHPDSVTANVPYELTVKITDTGDMPALYSSLQLDVGGAAKLVNCDANLQNCTDVVGGDVRSFGDIEPGQTVAATFTIMPLDTGPITSCVGISDQNISLQVSLGSMGCLVGQLAPERGVPDGVPTVQVAPAPNQLGVSPQSPVTAFFSQQMSPATISTGNGGTFNVYDVNNNLVPGLIQQITLNSKTVAIWQALDPIFGGFIPLNQNTTYTVLVTQGAVNMSGVPIYNVWQSTFTTTGTGVNDNTPPTLEMGGELPVNPSYVLPGQLVKIDAYSADQGSGVARIELRMKDLTAGDTAYKFIDRRVVFGTDLPPFTFTVDSAKLVPGHTYQFLGTAFDNNANTQDATLTLNIAPSAAAPTLTLPSAPAQGVAQGISVSLTPTTITGGVVRVDYYLDGATTPFNSVTLPPYQTGLATLTMALGNHTIVAVAVDGLGQSGQGTFPFTLVANPNKPQITMSGLVSGATFLVGSSFVVSGSAADPVGLNSLLFYLDSTGGTPVGSGDMPFSISTAGLSLGAHQLIGQAVNALGTVSTSTVNFTVAPVPNGAAPSAPSIATISVPSLNGTISITGSSAAGARIDITNRTQMFGMTVNADDSGHFGFTIPGAGGDLITLVAYDFKTSQLPSLPASATVPAAPTLVSLSAAPASLTFTAANATRNLAVTGNYQDGSSADFTAQSSFSSSDPSVAAVSAAGQVVALKSGTTTITVTAGGKQTQVTVTVNIVVLTSISVNPTSINSIYLADARQLAVTGNYSDGSTATLNSGVTFSTGNSSVAIVTSFGLVTTTGNGLTTITAYYPGVQPAAIAVTVNTALDTPPQVQVVSPANGASSQRGDIVSVSVRATDAVGGGVNRITLIASGAGGDFFTETHQFQAILDTTTVFNFTVPDTLPIGSSITVTAGAVDTGNNQAQGASITLNVVDTTAPVVTITAPAPQTPYNYGDKITLSVHATDRVGVSRIRYVTSGAFVTSGSQELTPASTGDATFTITVPFGTNGPSLGIVAYASDPSGNEGASTPMSVIITSADITAPVTKITSVSNPGSGTTTTLTYQVTDGLSDLDHVEIFFRRNGLGTFNRYFDPDRGYPDGKYLPQSGAVGTLTFDSTKMGGDGTYEFYSVGVDKAGNREAVPYGSSYPGLIGSYPFNGTTNDQSASHDNGTLSGASYASDRFGQTGRALSFNGSSNYVGIGAPVPAPLQIQNEITLSAWIYVTGYPGSGTLGTIVGCQHDSGNNTGYAIQLDGRTNPDSQPAPAGHLHFQIGNGSWHTTNANQAVPLNRWVHVAATRKANEDAKIYYDGVLQPSTSLAWDGSIGYTGAEFDIGRQSDFSDRYFKGSLDDVQIYNRALSDVEIQRLAEVNQTAVFNAGTSWTVIASATSVGEGDTTYDNRNLRVSGTTLTLNGAHSFKNVELVNGAVLTHSAGTDAATHNLNLNLWTLTIDQTSMVDLNGRGFRGGRANVNNDPGLTSGNLPGSGYGSGGSHGGLGSVYDTNGAPAPVYDSFVNPAEPGGGGGNYGGTGSGAGGGLFFLNAINLVNDNLIRADGALSAGSASGDGAGGSINITVSSVSGNGGVTAKGGGSGVGVAGGGGRIAINYLDISTLNQAGLSVDGGQGQYGINGILRAANGTIFLKQQSLGAGDLVIDGQAGSTAWTPLTIPNGYSFNNITLRNSARVVTDSAIQVTGRLYLTGNSTLTHSQGNEAGLAIAADTVQVDAGSAIDATGRGYRGGQPNINWDTGLTLGGISGSPAQTGGSYGGKGAGYQSSDSGLVYGDPRNPVYLGAGGGNYGGTGSGAGGGRITIQAGTALIVDGAIRADGAVSTGSASGDGAGGSVLIKTSRFAGNGTISANGGGSSVGAAGGGGRVAVYCDYLDSSAPLGNLRNLSAFSGHGQYDNLPASAGTVYVKYNQGEETLFIDDNQSAATSPRNTPLTPIGSGVSLAVTNTSLQGDGQIPFIPGGLVGLRLNPDLNQQESFAVSGNTVDTISVVTPNEHGVSFATLAATGKSYGGFYHYDNLTFRRGGNLLLGDRLQVANTLNLAEHGLLSHYAATDSFTSGLYLTLGTLNIDSTSRIDVTGRGYRGGRPNINWDAGLTTGNTPGSINGTGGSHGGLGVTFDANGIPAPLFDSLTNPADLGGGGGNYGSAASGAGGGRVLITAGNIALDGAIVANGAVSSGSASGCGAGGTINIVTGSFTGGGSLHADGGGSNVGTGGGGGRIAVVYSGSFGIDQGSITALGGLGQYGNGNRGGIGTVFLRDVTQPNGSLIVDGNNLAVADDSMTIPGGLTFDSIVLRNHARATADGGLKVTGQLLLTGNSTLTHSAGNEAGLIIDAKDMRIDAGSSLDVSGRGYRGGRANINWDTGITLGGIAGSAGGGGGSYGGKGGGYSGSQSGLIYGDPRNPVYLGSGGGNWGGNSSGAGGGRISINASNSLQIDGSLHAEGGVASGSASGDGSGGSILIHTSLFSGTGSISANGGGHASLGVGGTGVSGGGGRVAIYCDSLDQTNNLGSLRNVSAFPGRDNYDTAAASAGTVYFKYNQGAEELFIDGNSASSTASGATPLPHIGSGTTVAVTGDTLTLDGQVPLLPGGLAGVRLNPDTTQQENFAVKANGASSITVVTPNEHGVAFLSIAAVGLKYGGVQGYDNLTFRRGGNLLLDDPLTVTGTLSLAEYGLMSHLAATDTFTSGLKLTVGNFLIDATGRIDVTGCGYRGGRANINYDPGLTAGNLPGSAGGAGGSHGGLGGSYSGAIAAPVYDSYTAPVDLGGGGGNWGVAASGAGGGRVLINATSLSLNGMIVANGGLGSSAVSGNGAGGTVNITATTLAGTGSIQAQGGASSQGVGGGGGRVALRYGGTLGLTGISVAGGTGGYGTGNIGTIYLEQH